MTKPKITIPKDLQKIDIQKSVGSVENLNNVSNNAMVTDEESEYNKSL